MRFILMLFVLIPFFTQAQTKNCSTPFIEKKYKDAIRPYLDDEYELESTDYFTSVSNQKVTFKKLFDSDYEYILLLITPNGANAGSIELLDKSNYRQEFEKEMLQLETDFIEMEFEPDYDETYTIVSSISYNTTANNCTILAILKRETEEQPVRRK
jgi:hypothetical protein